jgi:hypothetical protein
MHPPGGCRGNAHRVMFAGAPATPAPCLHGTDVLNADCPTDGPSLLIALFGHIRS